MAAVEASRSEARLKNFAMRIAPEPVVAMVFAVFAEGSCRDPPMKVFHCT
jgi:hypothetical protein